jgi:uncharacterized protein (TIGR02147 family)
MPNIFEYTDYKKFLADYYEKAKERNPGFSYQVFSQKAGIKSRGFLYNAVHGKRTLSKSHVFGLSQALNLNKSETAYLENLVAFNQAKSLKERNYFYERLSSIRPGKKHGWKPQIVRNDQFEFYSKWYHSVIRSLIDLHGFAGDYEKLARNVYPRIKPLQAKKSVELLLRLGLVRKRPNGSYAVTDKSIATPKEVAGLAVMNFHRDAGRLAMAALNDVHKDRRNFSAMTLGISHETYKEICNDILALRRAIQQKAEADNSADAVYQLNFQFFPVSRTDINTERNPT